MTVSEAFERYIFDEIKLKARSPKTARNYRSVLNSFIDCNGDIPVEVITYDCVIRWKMHMDYKGHQVSTISSNLSKLREVLKYLRKRQYNVLEAKDVELPKVPIKEVVWLEPKEVLTMIDHASNLRDKAIISTLFSTGARISEVLSLDTDSILNCRAQVIGKGSKLISLHFDTKALERIQAYLDTRNDNIPALFISGQYRRITVSRVEQIIHKVAAEAGISKNVTPHTLRHSFATDMLMNGADIRTTQEHLNHNSIVTTQRYVHVSKSHKDDTYNRHHTVL